MAGATTAQQGIAKARTSLHEGSLRARVRVEAERRRSRRMGEATPDQIERAGDLAVTWQAVAQLHDIAPDVLCTHGPFLPETAIAVVIAQDLRS